VFEQNLHPPKSVFSLEWNSEIEKRSKNISEVLRMGRVETDKDLLIVHLMQSLAREEGEPFRSARLDEYGCCLALHAHRQLFVGYIMWSDDEKEATLRQIYIVPEERRRGLAAQLVTHWVHEYADRIGNRFAVESPNEKSVSLLVKLGFAALEGSKAESKCFFIGGM
jgi:ribosomal protein S18 acetylase RimI-like enzyme